VNGREAQRHMYPLLTALAPQISRFQASSPIQALMTNVSHKSTHFIHDLQQHTYAVVTYVQKRPRSKFSSVTHTQLDAWYAAPIAVVAPLATRLPSMVAKYA
jgi:hypothetical protein